MKAHIVSAAFLLLGSVSAAYSQSPCDGEKRSLHRVTTNDIYSWFTINKILNWYGNNGNSSYNVTTGNGGLEYPKGSGRTAVFTDGVVWGGFHKGRTLPKVGGSVYRYGLQAGVITAYGGPTDSAWDRPAYDDPTLSKYRVYRVRPDITPTTPDSAVRAATEEEAALLGRYLSITPRQVFDQYVQDWNEWPAKDGLPAPFTDVDRDGRYDPAIDIPGQPGAAQTLYYVANDMNVSRVANLSSSPPIGLEMHRTVWGYSDGGAVDNMIFASTLLMNKSGAPVDSMFLVQWSDVDLGNNGDDFVGCDVPRSLGFIYNGLMSDAVYGTDVPAVGYALVQGPLIRTGNMQDSAIFRMKYRGGYRNLEMTSFAGGMCASIHYSCPPPSGMVGSDAQWYRIMNGRVASTGMEQIDPFTGQPTKFLFSGEPATGRGFVDGRYGLVPGDRNLSMSTGPFTLANGDTQEIVVATIIGDGADRLSSVYELKHNSDIAQMLYHGLMAVSPAPPSPDIVAGELDGEVTLTWADSAGATKIEKWRSPYFVFEGYNVYQFPTSVADLTKATRLATYDIVNSVTTIFDDIYDANSGYLITAPVQFGTDSGIRRSFTTRHDAIGKRPLANGTTYYFGVTSYSFNVSPIVMVGQMESVPRLVAVTPQSPPSGTAYHASRGDTLPVVHTVGSSSAKAHATVIDPTRVADRNYQVRIMVTDSVMDPDLGVRVPNPRWILYDAFTNRPLTEPSTDFACSGASPIVDGIQVGLSLAASSTTKDVTEADRWDYSTVGLAPTRGDRSLALGELQRINVYPNPYVGFNPRESNKYQRFVTFTHLPERATIRIFNLAGVLVRTLVKNEPGQFYRWDLSNENGYRVGTGMYIVRIELPDLGRSKVLKLAVIPEQPFVDHW